jgi:acetylornithine deacetylase/succinyl-diaminopimelate desuccinylase-like protein
MLSGYTGEGAKTVLPARAMAKVSFRLVPNQDPKRIEELVTPYPRRGAAGRAGGGPGAPRRHPWRATLGSELYEAAERAMGAAWGRDVAYAGEGGSIPIVPEFERGPGRACAAHGLR